MADNSWKMLAVAYNQPLSKIVLSAFAMGLSASAIAGELERGTPDWWLNITVLLATSAVTFGVALLIFERRNLTRQVEKERIRQYRQVIRASAVISSKANAKRLCFRSVETQAVRKKVAR